MNKQEMATKIFDKLNGKGALRTELPMYIDADKFRFMVIDDIIQVLELCCDSAEEATRNSDSPLSVEIEGEELVIRIGIDRLDGHDCHPHSPALKFEDKQVWVNDVIYEIERQEEDGSCPISDLLDKAMSEAIEQGSAGIAEDSPTHVGRCSKCEEPFMPLRWFKDGDQCPECIGRDSTEEE